jgi:hypothetical protein
VPSIAPAIVLAAASVFCCGCGLIAVGGGLFLYNYLHGQELERRREALPNVTPTPNRPVAMAY